MPDATPRRRGANQTSAKHIQKEKVKKNSKWENGESTPGPRDRESTDEPTRVGERICMATAN